MVVENEQHFQFAQFEESSSLPTLDDRSIDMDALTNEDRDGSSLLSITGIITALSGLGIFLASNLDAGLSGMKSILVGAGIVGLGIGFGRVLMKLLKRRGISLPAIKVKRKTEARNSSYSSTSTATVSPSFGSFREKQGGFSKSMTDTIISGVCGGIAESSGISSAVIRAIFIAAFAFTGGTAIVIYLLLYFLMKGGGETIIQKIDAKTHKR